MASSNQQEYDCKPLTKHEVRGASSKTIFKFMTNADLKNIYYPLDVDDFERNRALLLWYPEWRSRITEMASICEEWRKLTEVWLAIEKLYEIDYERYGKKIIGGECCKYIQSLVRPSPKKS